MGTNNYKLLDFVGKFIAQSMRLTNPKESQVKTTIVWPLGFL
jgi:hypothetical protein